MNALSSIADTSGLAALQLFRDGNDTAAIAAALGVTEAHASRLVWLERCRAKGLPAEIVTPSGALRRLAP